MLSLCYCLCGDLLGKGSPQRAIGCVGRLLAAKSRSARGASDLLAYIGGFRTTLSNVSALFT